MVETTLKQADKSLSDGRTRKDLLLSWLMAAWIAIVWMYLIRRPQAQATLYIGLKVRWLQDIVSPLFIEGTFLIAPFVGGCSAIRLVRRRQGQASIAMGLLLVVFFTAVLFLACATLLYDRNQLYDAIRSQ